jgi:hypothetical protein
MPASASAEHEKTPPEKGRGSCTTPAAMYQKTTRYCWRTYFKVLGVLFLGKISPAFSPSKKACGTHQFRHLGVRQQYPTLFRDSADHKLYLFAGIVKNSQDAPALSPECPPSRPPPLHEVLPLVGLRRRESTVGNTPFLRGSNGEAHRPAPPRRQSCAQALSRLAWHAQSRR